MNLRRTIAGTVAGIALVLVAACSSTTSTPVAQPTQTAAVPTYSAPAPAPVSTQASLSSTCTTGIKDTQTGTFISMTAIESGTGFSGVSTGDLLYEGYQVTLTNNSEATAEVNGLSVVFYTTPSGTPIETSSDSENVNQTFIAPGQSLTWTETPWDAYPANEHEASIGPFSAGQMGGVDSSATCQLVQWTTP